jgi:hypothetical protein
MYAVLLRFLPPRAAETAAAVIYALMILAILYTCVEPQAEFSYLRF